MADVVGKPAHNVFLNLVWGLIPLVGMGADPGWAADKMPANPNAGGAKHQGKGHYTPEYAVALSSDWGLPVIGGCR